MLPSDTLPHPLCLQLPPEMDILCTHPMFGPDSGKGAWTGLNLMYERVRVGSDPQRQQRCDAFLQVLGQAAGEASSRGEGGPGLRHARGPGLPVGIGPHANPAPSLPLRLPHAPAAVPAGLPWCACRS